MPEPFQPDPADIDEIAKFIEESGEPQPLEELALRYIEILRQRLLSELNDSQ